MPTGSHLLPGGGGLRSGAGVRCRALGRARGSGLGGIAGAAAAGRWRGRGKGRAGARVARRWESLGRTCGWIRRERKGGGPDATGATRLSRARVPLLVLLNDLF